MITLKTRKESIEIMKQFYSKGYRWIARDEGMDYLSLFSLKPKKYMDIRVWGYVNPDAQEALMGELISNIDIAEIRWENRQPTDLEQFIKDNEVAENESD